MVWKQLIRLIVKVAMSCVEHVKYFCFTGELIFYFKRKKKTSVPNKKSAFTRHFGLIDSKISTQRIGKKKKKRKGYL